MSLLSIALHQAQLGTWWNEPTLPWKSNRKRLANCAERRQKLLDELERLKKPILVSDLAASNDCSIQSIRSLSIPLVEKGKVRRIELNKKIALEYVS